MTIITGNSVESIVKSPKHDVLLEVYAPWCGHCKVRRWQGVWGEGQRGAAMLPLLPLLPPLATHVHPPPPVLAPLRTLSNPLSHTVTHAGYRSPWPPPPAPPAPPPAPPCPPAVAGPHLREAGQALC